MRQETAAPKAVPAAATALVEPPKAVPIIMIMIIVTLTNDNSNNSNNSNNK